MTDLDRARRSTAHGDRIPEDVAVAFNKYMLEIARILKVGDWIIVINDYPPKDETATATMTSRFGQKFAGVWLSDRMIDPKHPQMSDELRTQVLIHEVVHLHFEQLWHFIEDVAEAELHKQAATIFIHTFKGYMEEAIDQLAWALCDVLPPFKFPVKKR